MPFLSILMGDFLFQSTSFFVIVLFLLRLHAVTTPVYGFSIVIKLLTLELIQLKCAGKLTVMNSFINMKGCSANNINRNLIQ